MSKLAMIYVAALILALSHEVMAGDFDPPNTSGGTGTVHCDPAGHCTAGFTVLLSQDYKSIVGKDGKVISPLKKPIISPLLNVADDKKANGGSVKMKLQGCMRCSPECIVYDSNGNCIKSIQSCTWDFDC